ncbi:hypothetical protein LOK49_LG03G03611 [Camellia lanceoleosa]|uniref:Uncharacterized protein n=1 Tax=Camellia lanceoleosa TaxID=1840588 RepID=A0ACC0IDQ7_9ERIC|nr:hypothetical protein LOK49_LG03G03611 [Camellia lanceoleosa]
MRIIYDQESLHSPSNDNHYQLEAEEFRGTNLCKPSQVDVECLHHENETEVFSCARESYSMEDANQEEEMEDSITSPSYDNIVKETLSETLLYELTKSEFVFKELEEKVLTIYTKKLSSSPRSHKSSDETKSENICYSRNSPTERTLELSESPATTRQEPISPEKSPWQDLKDQSYSSRSQRVKHSVSSKNFGLGKEICSNDHSPHSNRQDLGNKGWKQDINHNTQSRIAIHQRSRLVDGGSLKCVSTSPRNHYSPKNDGRIDSLEYKRDYNNRSRSRSPHTRNHHRMSPYTRNHYKRSLRRDSPRRKSFPLHYQSYHRSPKRRPWLPRFSFLTTERDLEKKFSRYGRVRDVRIVRDKSKYSGIAATFSGAYARAYNDTQWRCLAVALAFINASVHHAATMISRKHCEKPPESEQLHRLKNYTIQNTSIAAMHQTHKKQHHSQIDCRLQIAEAASKQEKPECRLQRQGSKTE